jgi:ABC-type nitrate/sulfonate/bicarbonate transport system ATPase subunit
MQLSLNKKLSMQIFITNLSFSYDDQSTVFNDLNLHCDNNHTIALVGASGCGKSTFLRLCCGILPNSKHQSLMGNLKINGNSPSELVKNRQVGFMFQEPALLPNMTVWDNIILPLKLHKTPEASLRTQELIDKVGLTEYAKFLPDQLSGGMKTRVSLARTFITKPRLLLLDEPFSSLDIKWKFLLYRELETLISEYQPMVIMVTHDINEALLLSNHIFVFGKNGSILKELRISKSLLRVFKEDSLKELQDEYFEIQGLIMND